MIKFDSRSCAPALLLAMLMTGPAAAIEPAGRICVMPTQAQEKLIRKGIPAAQVAVPDFTRLGDPVRIASGLSGSIRRVNLPPGLKLVALTFDLCETANEVAGYDGAIFDTLRAEQVPATVFSGGHWAVTHRARFAELATDPLFEIGNHTWTHANLRTADSEALKREVLAPIAAFAQSQTAGLCRALNATTTATTSTRPTLFRFPFGACDARSMAAVNDAGMLAIQWDVSTADASPFLSADAIVRSTLAQIRPGSIILAHANGRGYQTGAALPRLIHELKARGYSFVTVSQLLAAGRPVVTPSCYDSRPGDTDKYDSWSIAKHPGRPVAPVQKPATIQTSAPLGVPK